MKNSSSTVNLEVNSDMFFSYNLSVVNQVVKVGTSSFGKQLEMKNVTCKVTTGSDNESVEEQLALLFRKKGIAPMLAMRYQMEEKIRLAIESYLAQIKSNTIYLS